MKDRAGEVWAMSDTVLLILETFVADEHRSCHRMLDLVEGRELGYLTYEGKVDEWDANPYRKRIV